MAVVILSNGAMTGVPEGLAVNFLDYALYGELTNEWLDFFKHVFAQMAQAKFSPYAIYDTPPAAPTPPLANEAYIGTYANDFFGEISIVAHEGGLDIVQGPQQQMIFLMTHFGYDTFTYITEGENMLGAGGTAGIIFTIGPDGKATSVLVQNLEIYGEGTSTRVAIPIGVAQEG